MQGWLSAKSDLAQSINCCQAPSRPLTQDAEPLCSDPTREEGNDQEESIEQLPRVH